MAMASSNGLSIERGDGEGGGVSVYERYTEVDRYRKGGRVRKVSNRPWYTTVKSSTGRKILSCVPESKCIRECARTSHK